MREFFDRQGNEITAEQWRELFENKHYQQVAAKRVGEFLISTVWLGFDHGFDELGEEPLLFETIVFDKGGTNVEQWRCSTEEQALAHHVELVNEVSLLEAAKS